jgi:acetylglutamate kinase
MNEYLHLYTRNIGSPERSKPFRPTIIKIGGSTVAERENTVRDIAFLYQSGIPVLVVHGGGIEIEQRLRELNISSEKIDGERMTTDQILKAAVFVLDGINAQIVEQLSILGVPAEGYSSLSKLLQGTIENPSLGFVGKVTGVKRDILNKNIAEKVIPVISPIAITQDSSQLLNVNADTAAGEIASSLGFDLVLLTDVVGVLDTNGDLVSELAYADYQRLQQTGVITQGMIPKLRASFTAAELGKVFICQSSELIEVFFGKPKGTSIKYGN